MAVVKEITSGVFGPDGNETMAPGTRVPDDVDLPPDVRWRHVTVADPEPPAEPEPEKTPAPARQSATVKAAPAEGKGSAHK